MSRCIIKIYHADTDTIRHLFLQVQSGLISHIGKHDASSSVGDQAVAHDYQTLFCLCIVRQVGGDIVFYLGPGDGDHTENQCKQIQDKEKMAFIHDEGGHFFHFIFLGLGFHKGPP